MLLRKKLNVEKNYKYLGVVSEKELYSLMYYSLSLINPSLFEGWNTSVMQAKSLNKSIILSDIDTHVEQKSKNFFYFKSNNLNSLCNVILFFLRLTKKKKILNEQDNHKNFLNYGKVFIDLVNTIFQKNI